MKQIAYKVSIWRKTLSLCFQLVTIQIMILVFILLLSYPTTCFSQAGCGSLSNTFSPPLGGEPAIRIYDRFGNEYSQESIQVPRVPPGREGYGGCDDCNSGVMDIGIFRLFFMDIIEDTQHGFDEASPLCTNRKLVLCQVFNDLKNFLVIASPGTPRVNIRIRKSGVLNLSGTANPLAAASSFYLTPNGQMDGIVGGETWKSITGNEDPYLNYPPALLQQSATAVPGNAGYFHGDIRFFFPENSEYYHTDFTTVTPDNTHDMYTIALHEVMHMLGFASLIGENGQSNLASCPGCYSIYDSYLELNGQSIISQNPGPNISCEEIVFGGPGNMAVGCANGVVFNGDSNPDQDVFSPNSWLNGSSLSHFECSDNINICPFQNSEYVMTWCNQGGPEFTRRHPSQEEANTFCDLGYRRNNTWGDGGNPLIFKIYTACSGTACLPAPVAYNDYLDPSTDQPLIIASSSPSLSIQINVILNDYSSEGVACASIVSGGGTVELIPGAPKIIRYFIPTSAFVGYVIIKYKAYKNCLEGQILSNDAYVFIQVDFPPVCSEDDCNLICGGDFEETIFASAYSPFVMQGNNSNSPDIFKRNPATGLMAMLTQTGLFANNPNLFGCNAAVPIPEPYSPLSNSYIGFGGNPAPNGGSAREGIMFNLNQPMLAGSHYRLTFWARGSHEDCLPTINIWGDDVQPCTPPEVTLLDGNVSSCGFTATLLGSVTLTDEWVQYSININPLEDINFIIVANAVPITIQTYTLIDDIVLTQDPSPINLSVSSTVDNLAPCVNGIVTINYNIELLPGQITNPNPINLQAILPPGFSIIAPSDFLGSGQHVIPSNTLQPGVPYPLILTLQLNGVPSGIPYEITLDIIDNGSACYDASSSSTVIVVTPSEAILSINTYASNSFVTSGDEVTVYIEVCNHSENEITGIVVTDLLPPNLTFISSPDLTLNGNELSSHQFDLLGIDPGLPPNCLTFSFLAKVEFTAQCSSFEDCATATYLTCADVTDCVQFVSTSNADIELSNTNNLDPVLQPTGETGKSISIMGTFTILSGTTYTFDGCDILMHPDAEIILESNATLNLINGTYLYGCDDLWKSITVNDDATLIINSGSIIQDARRGIDVPATVATLSLNDCIFRNNYIGIFAHYGNNALINGMIRNTTFECPNPIYEYNNQTLAGIYLHRASIPNIRNCAFTDLNLGIYANSSPLQVSFCHFKNIQPYYAAAHSGTGVVSFTKGMVDLIVHGNYGQDPAFEDCMGGIYSLNTGLQVLNLDMKNVSTGVEFRIINAPVEYPTLIAQTNIKCSKYGIKGLIFSSQQNPLIHSNFVEVTDANHDGDASGIFVESDIVQSSVGIIGNTVHVEDGKFGIFVRNFLEANVVLNGSGNDPKDPIMLNSSNATGIQIENNHFGFVGCNYVTDGSSMDNTTGINIVSSPLIEFDCNHVDQTAVGIRFNGVCNTPEKFGGNDFGNHTTGFQIANFGLMGDQTHKGNIWDGVALLEAQNLGDPDLSAFIIDDDVIDFLPNPIFPAINWFTPLATNNSYTCNQSPCPLSKPANSPVVDDVDLKIAAGTSSKPITFTSQGMQWMSESYLYEKLKAYPDLVSQNTNLTNFLNDYAQTSAGELFDIHQHTINMAGFGSDTLDFLSQIADINVTYSQRLLEIDSLLNLTTSTTISEELLSEKLTILQSLLKNIRKTEILQTSLNELIAEKSDNLQVRNNNVISANLLETNYQAVSRIWLQSVGVGKPDLLYNNASELNQIARQCPYEGGWAVYWARGLYSYIESQHYDDDQLCANSHDRKESSPVVLNPALCIMPNPANDMVNLSWTFEHSSEFYLMITNSLQQPVFISKVNGSSTNIDVQPFQSGVYYAFLIQEGKKVLSKPFVIVK